MNNTKRYMINPETQVIYPYCAEDMKANKKLQECTVDGVIFGKAQTPVDDLYAKIAEMDRIIAEKDMRIASLESYIAKLEEIKNAGDDVRRRRELEDMTLDDLKQLCTEYCVVAKGNKNNLIQTILAAEAAIKETE